MVGDDGTVIEQKAFDPWAPQAAGSTTDPRASSSSRFMVAAPLPDRREDVGVSASSPHTAGNRSTWNLMSDWYQAQHGPQLDTRPLAWGAWAIPESQVGALGDIRGKSILELGCGAGQWSMFLAEAVARPVGFDVSERQLAAARGRMRSPYALVHADGEQLPFAGASFDLVLSDHGAMSWADPFRTVPEVARVLRPGGRLVFNASTPWLSVCSGDSDSPSSQLTADYFGLHQVDEGRGASTFVLGYGEWIRLFRRNGLSVEDLVELRPPAGATTAYEGYVSFEWARRWPAEAIWVTTREDVEPSPGPDPAIQPRPGPGQRRDHCRPR